MTRILGIDVSTRSTGTADGPEGGRLMGEQKRIYLVSFEHQRKQVGDLCWGSCGYGLIGGYDLGHEDREAWLRRLSDG